MKRILFASVLAMFATSLCAADVAMSISVGEPGFYGQIDIGGYPPPRLISRRPVLVQREAMAGPPIYLRVPPGHTRNWRKHCREYDACGQPVYFVRDSWYQQEYVPRYQQAEENRRAARADRRREGGWNRRPPEAGRMDQMQPEHERRDEDHRRGR